MTAPATTYQGMDLAQLHCFGCAHSAGGQPWPGQPSVAVYPCVRCVRNPEAKKDGRLFQAAIDQYCTRDRLTDLESRTGASIERAERTAKAAAERLRVALGVLAYLRQHIECTKCGQPAVVLWSSAEYGLPHWLCEACDAHDQCERKGGPWDCVRPFAEIDSWQEKAVSEPVAEPAPAPTMPALSCNLCGAPPAMRLAPPDAPTRAKGYLCHECFTHWKEKGLRDDLLAYWFNGAEPAPAPAAAGPVCYHCKAPAAVCLTRKGATGDAGRLLCKNCYFEWNKNALLDDWQAFRIANESTISAPARPVRLALVDCHVNHLAHEARGLIDLLDGKELDEQTGELKFSWHQYQPLRYALEKYKSISRGPSSELLSEYLPELGGARMILAERERQQLVEANMLTHDDQFTQGEMALAAMAYIFKSVPNGHEKSRIQRKCTTLTPREIFPWDDEFWKPKDPVRNLVRAGALIAAEIDRVQRAQASNPKPENPKVANDECKR